jgi:hypothetical protein
VRGDGGYVIMPGSRRADGKVYEANQPFDPAAIAEAPAWLYGLICRNHKPGGSTRQGGNTGFPYTSENERELRDALFAIPADAREMWLKIGAALNSLTPEWGCVARELWDEWSQTEPGSFDAEDQDKTWEGFDPARPNGATVKTIFFKAKEHGWTPQSNGNSEDKGLRGCQAREASAS